MNSILVDLRKNIISPNFVLSVLLMMLLCLLSDAPTVSAREPLSVLDEIVKMRKEIWIEEGVRFSAQAIVYNFNNSIWYSVVLPIIASFPVLYNFSDEWFGDNYIMTLSRCGYGKFTISKLLSAFITGIMTTFIGIAIFGIIVSLIFPQADNLNEKSMIFDSAYLSYKSALTAKIINNSIVCGIYASLSIFVCLVLKDKFFTLSVFMVLNYFSMKLNNKFTLSVSMAEESNRAKKAFFPDEQVNIYSIFPNYLHISFYWYVVCILVIFIIISLLSYVMIRRRYKYAS